MHDRIRNLLGLNPIEKFEFGLNADQMSLLSTYNSEVARGIVHTGDWDRQMAALQTRFNRHA